MEIKVPFNILNSFCKAARSTWSILRWTWSDGEVIDFVLQL